MNEQYKELMTELVRITGEYRGMETEIKYLKQENEFLRNMVEQKNIKQFMDAAEHKRVVGEGEERETINGVPVLPYPYSEKPISLTASRDNRIREQSAEIVRLKSLLSLSDIEKDSELTRLRAELAEAKKEVNNLLKVIKTSDEVESKLRNKLALKKTIWIPKVGETIVTPFGIENAEFLCVRTYDKHKDKIHFPRLSECKPISKEEKV